MNVHSANVRLGERSPRTSLPNVCFIIIFIETAYHFHVSGLRMLQCIHRRRRRSLCYTTKYSVYFSKYCSTLYKNSGVNCNWSSGVLTAPPSSWKGSTPSMCLIYRSTTSPCTLYSNLDLEVVENLLTEMIELIFSNINKFVF